MANQTVYPYGTGGQLPSSIGIINDLTTGGADKALSAEMGKEIGNILVGESGEVISNWGEWTYSPNTPYRAFTIAARKTVEGGIITVKLSSYSTYKFAITVQNGTAWTSETITETGWQTSDVTKVLTGAEAGYDIRVSIGRVDNASINLTEFLSVIEEISYTYTISNSGGLINDVQKIGVFTDDSSYDLAVSDESGNNIIVFKNGHVKTKNFDSENFITIINNRLVIG